MKRRFAMVMGAVAAVLLVFAVVQLCRIYSAHSLEGRAESMLETGDYVSAMKIYSRLGNTEAADYCLELQCDYTYQSALDLFLSGSYEEAAPLFSELGEYQSAQRLLVACNWEDAVAAGDMERLLTACEAFSLHSYSLPCASSLAQIQPVLYAEAQSLAADFQLEQACEIWSVLGDYSNSATLLMRGTRAIQWASADSSQPIIADSNRYLNDYLDDVYETDLAYVVIPENISADTKFFIYYPGGRNEELSVDYLLYYMMNPSPDTIAVFMRRNGLSNMRDKNAQAIAVLEQTAAECRLFVDSVVVAGSSLGAYPAMHSVVYSYEDFGIMTSCVLSLDAGSDWEETALLLTKEECLITAQLGTDFYLYESPMVGMNREGIRRMVNTGNSVTMVECTYDDHVRISLDAMGMGVVDWAVGSRTQLCNTDIYNYVKLSPDE